MQGLRVLGFRALRIRLLAFRVSIGAVISSMGSLRRFCIGAFVID